MVPVETPIGCLKLVAENNQLTAVYFGQDCVPPELEIKETGLLTEARQQLSAYFSGQLTAFTLPLAPVGTQFQKRVWQALCRIPYGETASYKEIACRIGNEKAARAVGGANHKNPIPIIIPCHRVIGANGALVGYGGGLRIKETLLALEQRYAR